jgi:hypothetical protein
VKKKKMKTKTIAFLVIAAVVMSVAAMGAVMAEKKDKCTTIQDGTITYGKVGDPSTDIIPIGYDQWGYNYQAHMFNGKWCDYHPLFRPGGAKHDWCVENMADVELMMKWSDEWLSNKDCNNDSNDRGYSCDPENAKSSGCSGAWLTNHEFGTYINDTGETCSYTYFCKIVAAPADAHVEDDVWYEADGTEIGPVIWSAFATIQEVENDPCEGLHGLQYRSPASPGLGYYNP